ncbi:MAG: hypothetical protein ACR2OR_09670 [Hyphomicrobiales bacterium]
MVDDERKQGMKTGRFKALLCSAAFALALSAGTALSAEAVTVISMGGSYTKSQVKAFHEPFVAKTGAKINSVDYNGGLTEVKAQIEADNVIWDIVDVELSDAMRGCDEGLYKKIDAASLAKN